MIKRRTIKQKYPLSADNREGPFCCDAERWFYRLRGAQSYHVGGATETGFPDHHRRFVFADGSVLFHHLASKWMMWTHGITGSGPRKQP